MARYIDAEKMPNDRFFEDLTPKEKAKVILWLLQAPTADVVEVVRCKDCKHRVRPSKMCAHPKAIGWDAIEPGDDDFCSCGEREDTETW